MKNTARFLVACLLHLLNRNIRAISLKAKNLRAIDTRAVHLRVIDMRAINLRAIDMWAINLKAMKQCFWHTQGREYFFQVISSVYTINHNY